VLSDLNHAVNFYLYFLSMATFRRRFLDTLQCRKPTRKPKGVSTSVFKTSHSYVSFHSTHSNLKGRAYSPAAGGVVASAGNGAGSMVCDPHHQHHARNFHSHSLTNVSDVSSEV
jgi:hypothetical protein